MNTNDPELTALKPSPFHYEKDWIIKKENYNKNCTHLQIETMIAKNLLNAIDLEILYLLIQYRYVNTNNITYYINNLSHINPMYMKPDYKTNLKKLYKAGVIIRYCCCKNDTTNTTETTSASHLRFYDLSPGAYSYMQNIAQAPYQLYPLSNIEIFELMAANQFIFRLLRHYNTRISLPTYCNKRVSSGDAFIEYGVLQLVPARNPNQQLRIHVLSHRESSSLSRLTIHKMNYLSQKFMQQTDSSLGILVITVENISLIYQLYKFFIEYEVHELIPFYFYVDTLQDISPLHNLYLCRTADDHYYLEKIALNI